ncbi:hypothetical protein FB381_3500 [Nocardioides albertanoniae]|uniref:Uncharacterized protein n=1 Tax=Nocardioides albertanoniae TaxID=1175486 RepID=A0A543AAQ3_9ACTN|nr:hypothetical protein FB381_3500 [Nocardioides albertanoniae]
MLAYAAVVLVGLLVLVQTLSPDVSSLHRVPRTIAGQADFTVVPPAPTPDVSGVDTIPGTGKGSGDGAGERSDQGGAGEAAQPGPSEHKGGDDTSPKPPAATPEDPPANDPTTPPDPGGDDDPAPPTLVPSVGPIPGIMAPLIWPFVSVDDSKPLNEAMPMFLQQLIEADPGATVGELPGTKDETISAGEAPKPPQLRQGKRGFAPERAPEKKTCDPDSEQTPEKRPVPGDDDDMSADSEPRDDDEATPECAEACADTKAPVGSSPAADGEDSTDDEAPSEEQTTESPAIEEPSDGSDEDQACAEKSAR